MNMFWVARWWTLNVGYIFPKSVMLRSYFEDRDVLEDRDDTHGDGGGAYCQRSFVDVQCIG